MNDVESCFYLVYGKNFLKLKKDYLVFLTRVTFVGPGQKKKFFFFLEGPKESRGSPAETLETISLVSETSTTGTPKRTEQLGQQ